MHTAAPCQAYCTQFARLACCGVTNGGEVPPRPISETIFPSVCDMRWPAAMAHAAVQAAAARLKVPRGDKSWEVLGCIARKPESAQPKGTGQR